MQDTAAYRLDFLMQFLLAFVQLGAELIALWTIFSNTNSLGGWGPMEILVLLGVFRIMTGTIAMIVAPNMRSMMEDIRDGKLDYVVLSPVNTQFLVSVRRVVLPRLADLAVGLGMVLFAAFKLSATVGSRHISPLPDHDRVRRQRSSTPSGSCSGRWPSGSHGSTTSKWCSGMSSRPGISGDHLIATGSAGGLRISFRWHSSRPFPRRRCWASCSSGTCSSP